MEYFSAAENILIFYPGFGCGSMDLDGSGLPSQRLRDELKTTHLQQALKDTHKEEKNYPSYNVC